MKSAEFREITELFINKGVFFDATLTAYGYYGRRGPEYDHWTDESRFFTSYIRSRRQPARRVNANFERIYQNKLKTVKAFFDAGGKVTLGTDHFSTGDYLAGFSAHRELEAFVRAGIPPVQAIKIATLNGAAALKLDKRTGSILAGKDADLFVITGDPIKDIKRTRSVHTVVRAGKVYKTADLLKSVEGKLGPRDEREVSRW